jgi:SAM-dependent methyltransferase
MNHSTTAHQHDYWTIEPDEGARRFGGRQHVVAPLERLGEFFPEGYFDLIICNRVSGYGLDSLEQCESAFAQCHTRLREQGHFVLGWNDVRARSPVPLENVSSLKRFRRLVFPPLGTSRYLTDTADNHVYDFYCK